MRVLILGGTGLISTGIVRQLIDDGHEVAVFNRGQRKVELPVGVEIIHGSRQDADALKSCLSWHPDAVIDMICFTPDEARLAVEVFAGNVGRFLFCSTVDVFTKPARYFPVDESHERNPSVTFEYAFWKKECEDILQAAHDNGAFELTTLRPAATYEAQMVAPVASMDLYVERLKAGLPVIIPGDGTAIWVVCHRDDVARAFVAALDAPVSLGKSYNVASSELLTWNMYWEVFAQALGAPTPTFLHIPTDWLAAADPKLAEWCAMNFQHNNILDSSLAARDLGFASRVAWVDGARMIADAYLPKPVPSEERARFERLVDAWQKVSNSAIELGSKSR